MRTLLTGERATTQGARVTHHLKVEVQNGSGTWKDLGALLGADYIVSGGWGETLDQAVSDASFRIRRRKGTYSLAPLVALSTLNVDDLAAYSPLLDIGRGIRASTATLAPGVAPVAGDYRQGFIGRIDTIAWESDPIVITCSDLGAWLMDTQIEVNGIQYGTSPVGTALETVIQNILNATPSGKGIPTLYTPTSPGYAVTSWAQGRTKVLDAVRQVALQSAGWDVRFRHDSSHVSRLTLFNPDRARVTIDFTLGPTEYRAVTRLGLAIADVRNVGLVPYTSAAGVTGTATAADAVSIGTATTGYGRRYFELAESAAIDTAPQAQALIDAVVSDLAGAPAEQEIETLFLWFVQLYDRLTCTANGVHYDQDQTQAIVGYRHEFDAGVGVTRLQTAGRVIGAYDDWRRGIRSAAVLAVPPSVSAAATETATTGTLVITPTDPQGRITRVEMATASGNTPLSAFATVALVGGVYTGTVALVEKQPSKIAWRMWATVGTTEQLVDGDSVRYAIGGIPLPPGVSYTIDAGGLLTVVANGDSSTTHNRIVVATDAAPTGVQVDASASLTGRDSSVTGIQLAAGEKFYIGAKSYNAALGGTAASQGSTLVPKTGQWLGSSSGRATVAVGNYSGSPTVVTLTGLTFGVLTTHVDVFVQEYRGDPGSVPSVEKIGYHLGPSPSIVTETVVYNGAIVPRNEPAPILIPVANAGNWLVVTLQAFDALNRVGAGLSSALGTPGGTLTLKIQAATASGTQPAALGTVSSARNGNQVELGVVMPASGVQPATVRWWRNGAPLQQVAAPGAGVSLSVFDHIEPGSYTYYAEGVSAAGERSVPTTPFTIVYVGTTVPTPALAAAAWNATRRGFDLTITPAAGTPAGTQYLVYHSPDGASWPYLGIFDTASVVYNGQWTALATTIFHAHDVDGTARNHYVRAYAIAPGYTQSALAYDGGGASPGTNRPIPASAP